MRKRASMFANVDVPRRGGVYSIWNHRKGNPVYVGESSNLDERIGDLMRPINHTFTRQIQKSTRIKSLERLRSYMSRRFDLSFVVLRDGRKELEEFLICYWKTFKYNKRPARYMNSDDYPLDI